ncbi:alpha-amylase family protein [Tenggerimyces flavus]|uniref:Alpha-amylase family protein n=1 Tax=Tenggerimyces flavus TaxID=1708749 RepID=A0ABV7YHG8_9ACTN|nr:alpha-amylase family protein [Tenggerimyces flavus]MBM7784703.1 maltose alpha-D-glucosyltransferase/alpha-amylase [Tenggerimyces flavus]
MRLTQTADLWWKNAVLYCVDVETFFDTDGDGRGDLRGLAQRIDHLAELGVTCLWLMPFYPTPDRDDGYDITDFYGVDSRLGSHGDFVELVRIAQDRGLRVISDLVCNHTSDQHPWFQSARASKDSPYRDWYVWKDEPPPDAEQGVVFPDQEKSLWTYDEAAGQYYLHRFYKHQPDLNVANPQVREEISRVIGFWLELGLSGFRVDAVPFLIETMGSADAADLPDPHDYLRDLRSSVSRRRGDAALLGEVNLPGEETRKFFGDEDGDELTMCFDFVGMQALYLSLVRKDIRPLVKALRERPGEPEETQWATFVRNHDELTLDKLSEAERQEVFDAFGPDPSMQLYGRGLRRRLPPMLNGDRDRIRMVYSLLFSLPGTPVLFYGEEIGMGENLDVEGRMAVRTPMQWTAGPSGGFTTGQKPATPLVEGEYGPENVNVAAQRRDPASLLSWMTLLIRRYRECPELAWGSSSFLDQNGQQVLVQRSDYEGGTVFALHNFGSLPAAVSLRLDDVPAGSRLVDLLNDRTVEVGTEKHVTVDLGRYGCRWLRVVRPGERSLT